MPGASSIKLTNWMYSIAPKDGTAIATVARGAPVHDLLGGSSMRFDPLKFNWIGSMNNEVSVCVTHARSPVKTFAQLQQAVVGGQGKSSDSEVFARFAKNLLGAKIKLISGYPGTKESILAMECGEVDGNCGWSWTSAKTSPEVPTARVAALRKTFMDTLASAPFKAFADKAGLEINPVPGEELQALVERVRKTPKDVVDATRRNIDTD
jgi:tripartite-type tricarboxylate transporter receptor subunit TctC